MSDRPTHSVPIDAEYEPAETPEDKTKAEKRKKAEKGGGPGWVALTFVALIALGALAVSVWSSGLLVQSNLPTPSETAFGDVREQQATLETRVGELSSQVEGLIDRVDSEIGRLDTEIAELPAETAPGDGETGGDMPAGLDARLTGLEEQVTSLTENQGDGIDPARIEAIERGLEKANQNDGPSNSQLVSLRTELETLSTELQTLEATQRDLATEIDDVRTDAADMRRASASVVSASLALSGIEAAANRGETFEEQYRQLSEARPDDGDVQALASLSRIEVPTVESLRAQFRELRKTAIARDTEESSGLGWVNTVFGETVSIRRTSGDSQTAERLADAEAALARDALANAVDAVEALPETVKPVFQTWLADARRRARLEQTLEDLRLKLIAAGQ
ncbi:MAG: hypothetical protein RIB03_08285 [Henriciella sp.]|uniref:COG4223 family protein n=1 Tax=Henriciella sp. TaxID=1968823 RepID=UPI0032EDADBA